MIIHFFVCGRIEIHMEIFPTNLFFYRWTVKTRLTFFLQTDSPGTGQTLFLQTDSARTGITKFSTDGQKLCYTRHTPNYYTSCINRPMAGHKSSSCSSPCALLVATLGLSWNFSLSEILASLCLQDRPQSGNIITQPASQPPTFKYLYIPCRTLKADWIFLKF